jgi:hypothetical protein
MFTWISVMIFPFPWQQGLEFKTHRESNPRPFLPPCLPSFLPSSRTRYYELSRTTPFSFCFPLFSQPYPQQTCTQRRKKPKKYTTPPLCYNNFSSEQNPNNVYGLALPMREMWRCTLGDGYFRWVSTKGHPPTRYLSLQTRLAVPWVNQQLHWYHGKTRGVSHCGPCHLH